MAAVVLLASVKKHYCCAAIKKAIHDLLHAVTLTTIETAF